MADPNGNNDSGYAPSQPDTVTPDSPRKPRTQSQQKKNGVSMDTEMR